MRDDVASGSPDAGIDVRSRNVAANLWNRTLVPIGELAAKAGLRPSALRYYERAGLLPPPVRVGGKRRYEPETLDRLTLIRFCQRAGFTLAEVRELLAQEGVSGTECWHVLAERKLAEVDALIERARAVRALLTDSLRCRCAGPRECPVIHGSAAAG